MENFFQKGLATFNAGNYPEALSIFQQGIKSESDKLSDDTKSNMYYYMSKCLEKMNKMRRAIDCATECCKLKPKWPQGYYQKGICLKKMKEYEEALDVLKIAHSLAPDDMDIKALLDEVTINYRDERECLLVTLPVFDNYTVKGRKKLKVVCVSDTHNAHKRISYLSSGDIFIHAGDITFTGAIHKLREFNDWLGTLTQFRYKIVISGNHDVILERMTMEEKFQLFSNAIYLEDSEVNIEGIRIYGSPWQPTHSVGWAFNLDRGAPIRAKWELIPKGVDILVTHGPPYGHGDKLAYGGRRAGCEDLLEVVKRLKPRVHIFGHVHEGYGVTYEGHTTFINASICDYKYRPVNKPVIFEI